ncbi:MAG: SpoIIE family protein phosphatase [Flavobacteriales bacterium]|nr:SpoIIE family protein phosphatase [Flavobacteriales bacterium]
MRLVKMLSRNLLLVVFLFVGHFSSTAQKNFTVRHFDETNGLSSNFTEGISQSVSGHLVVASKGGMDRFDGRIFEKLNLIDDTVGVEYATCLYRSKDKIWIGLFNGNIGVYQDGSLKEIATGMNGQVRHIYVDEKNAIWAFSRSGMVFRTDGKDTSHFNMSERDMLINAVIPYRDREFIIGSNDGLWLIRFETGNDFQVLKKVKGLPETKITAIKYEASSNIIWAGTEDDGLYRVYAPFSATEKIEKFTLDNGNSIDDVQSIFEDHRGRTWLGTFGNGLLRIEYFGKGKDDFITQTFEDNVESEYLIRDIFEDAENNIWIATFGGGLIQIVENVFHQPFDENWLRQQSITQLFRDSKGNVWLGIDKGIFKTSEYSKRSKFEYFHVGGNTISAIAEDAVGNIWVGTTTSGIFKLTSSSSEFKKIPLDKGNLADAINSITPTKDGVYVATKSGLFTLSLSGKIIKYLSTIDGLPHNNVRYCFEDTAGHLWIATQGNRVALLVNNEIRFLENGNSQNVVDVNHILQDASGKLWFATAGQGIYILDNGNASHLNSENGLPSDYCYQMVLDNDGYVWASHQKSIVQLSPKLKVSRIVGHEDISPVENTMVTFLFKDHEGNIWISSTHGVVKFNPAIDKSSKSLPQLSIGGMKLFDQNQPLTSNLILPYKQYKVTFNLAGISLRNPDNIRYKWKLEGYSDYWSEEISQSEIQIQRLEDGDYTLQVIASKNGGEWTTEPVEYSFVIEKPWWRTWWFYLFCVVGISGLILAFVRYRVYRLMIDKQELETIVTERTIEIQEQKSEIERSRDEIAKYAKDITDSIKYAKRIQNAIFPTLEDVNKVIPESFVLFKSKDLVSGDFYFAEKIGDERIFCAVDCTGHGVPGGFMSIVANNLLHQATKQLKLTKPSEILEYLNQGVTNTLHQTYEESSVKDGMDIALCSWNKNKNTLQFAGAYNPLYLFRDGELIEYRGDRFPVGRFVGEESNSFKNHEIKVKKGDMLYIFSDGFSDQFGGPEGKKFKVRRFKAMLQEVQSYSIENQFKIVNEQLENWIGDLEQIDDIVLIGVRIS